MEDKLISQLILHEGLKLKVYKCPAGFLTIGVGRNLETNPLTVEECKYLKLDVFSPLAVINVLIKRGITNDEAIYLLKSDIKRLTVELSKSLSWFDSLPEKAKIVLYDMAFNLGIAGLLKFKKSLALIGKGKYAEAGKEILNSAWKFQVGKRANTLAEQLKTI